MDAEALRAEVQREASDELCRRFGDLTHLMRPDQRALWDEMQARPASRWVYEIARKWGKTYFLVLIAAMTCLRKPNIRVVYGAHTLKALREFVLPIMGKIARLMPEDVRPVYKAQESHWAFPNGSWVHLFGADDEGAAERGRGPEAELAIFDEAGFCPVLQYVISQVFRPSMLLSGGWTLLGSTPASEPDHDFTRICEIAEANGNWFRRTVYDNPMLSPERIAEFIAEDARDNAMTVEEYKSSDGFKREYLALRVVDKTLSVMGEDWEKCAERSKREASSLERPQFFDAYAALDMGGVDPHAVLFGYWHFERAALVIEDELLLRDNENTTLLAEAIKAKERELWGDREYAGTLRGATDFEELPDWLLSARGDAPGQPYLRVCDNDIQIAKDLHQLHGISFIPTAKDEKWHRINEARVLLRSGRILIHPRCRHLERHLRTTVWANERRKDYRRKGGEHGDLVDALVYLVRNLNQVRNPVPIGWGVDPNNQVDTRDLIKRPEADVFARLFGMKNSA